MFILVICVNDIQVSCIPECLYNSSRANIARRLFATLVDYLLRALYSQGSFERSWTCFSILCFKDVSVHESIPNSLIWQSARCYFYDKIFISQNVIHFVIHFEFCNFCCVKIIVNNKFYLLNLEKFVHHSHDETKPCNVVSRPFLKSLLSSVNETLWGRDSWEDAQIFFSARWVI